jgi:hypothetical protein
VAGIGGFYCVLLEAEVVNGRFRVVGEMAILRELTRSPTTSREIALRSTEPVPNACLTLRLARRCSSFLPLRATTIYKCHARLSLWS